mmetsp:Transcript_24583/g.55960  ORF Transcript_24583/g.55960 Transcript_24583/m.55960 type:complete len:172 (-) Transcript_24583:413-928(-)
MQHSRAFYRPNSQRSSKMRHTDLYVVRLLPAGRRVQGSSQRDLARFGNSKPCLRCLRALEAMGVHRVVYTSGAVVEPAPTEHASPTPLTEEAASMAIPCQVRTVQELLAESVMEVHSSRGDVLQATAHGHAAAGAGPSFSVPRPVAQTSGPQHSEPNRSDGNRPRGGKARV